MATPNNINNQSVLPDYWYNNQIGTPKNVQSNQGNGGLGDYFSDKWNSFNNNYWNKNAGLGDYGTWIGQDGSRINVDKTAYDSIAQAGNHGGQLIKSDNEPGWFDINDKGVSKFGSVLSNVGTGVGIASGLASMYYAKKQADLNKERAKMEKDAYNRGVQREAQAEARMQQFAKNAGNNAFYA